VIGVAGGSASGKTSVSRRILQMLNVPWVIIVSMDSFYRPLTPEQREMANKQ
jgi:uridine kinase